MTCGKREKQLLSAIRHYRTQEAVLLLEENEGLDLDAPGDFPLENPLMLAVQQGNKILIRKLVEKGANVNIVLHLYEPRNEETIQLTEGHFGQEKHIYQCPLTEALAREEMYGLSEEIALLKAYGAKELSELVSHS